MCGRFSLALPAEQLAERFGVSIGLIVPSPPRYNIAPTQQCATVIIENNQQKLKSMRWGLIPHWCKGRPGKLPLINARAETIAANPSYRQQFAHRRCLVPADGFFEWKKSSGIKVPFRATLKNQKLFAFAGLWDLWQGENSQIASFTLITTAANSLLAPIHDRMPVILKPEDEALWMDSNLHNQDRLEQMLKPYPADAMELYKVSSVVNSWKIDSPECISPAF